LDTLYMQLWCLYKILTFTASEESTVCNSGVEAAEGNEATESFSLLCWEAFPVALMWIEEGLKY
jgi:hypothetical protein